MTKPVKAKMAKSKQKYNKSHKRTKNLTIVIAPNKSKICNGTYTKLEEQKMVIFKLMSKTHLINGLTNNKTPS